jgi:outer membrane protein assembly factor BamB
VADLGNRSFGSPVIADGKVFVATNNAKPRDPNVKGHKGVLMAFRESDGQFLWQIVHDYPSWDDYSFGTAGGVPSTPSVVSGKLYYMTPACEVVCANAVNGKIEWRYDMVKELQVHTCRGFCQVPPWSSPLVVGNLVFVVTGNGRHSDANDEWKLAAPEAPSFVALDKRTGKLVWQSNLPGQKIIDGQWSSPAYAEVGGRPQVIFAGGDCVIYSFAPESGALLWKCDCLPVRPDERTVAVRHWAPRKHEPRIDNYIVGAPVVVDDKLYVGLGLAREHPQASRWSYFLCLDMTKVGDVSLKSYDAKSALNKDSALVWAFGGPIEPSPKKGRGVHFGRTLSTAAVHEGLVYITEEDGYLHCLDALSGTRVWDYDLQDGVVGSPYWADGRVFVCLEGGTVLIFASGRTANLFATIDMEDIICTTPVAVNGTLYVATRAKLYAIGSR